MSAGNGEGRRGRDGTGLTHSPRRTESPEFGESTDDSGGGFSGDWLALREPFDSAARASAARGLHLQQALEGLVSAVRARASAVQRAAAPEPTAIPSGDRSAHSRTEGPSSSGADANADRATEADAQPRLRIIDLACGTGASLRALCQPLAAAGASRQHWTVLDIDAELLAQWPLRLASWCRGQALVLVDEGDRLRLRGRELDVEIHRRQIDLANDLETAGLDRADLITASALLDLVSEAWLDRLVAFASAGASSGAPVGASTGVATGATVLMALSVDGRHDWSPSDPADETVATAFAEHQGRDKGFGPALGGRAAVAAAKAFEAAGYEVRLAPSDWIIDAREDSGEHPGALTSEPWSDGYALQAGDPQGHAFSRVAHSRNMLQAMIDGLSSAAAEQSTPAAASIEAWRQRRGRALHQTRLVIGHLDLLAVPRAPASKD